MNNKEDEDEYNLDYQTNTLDKRVNFFFLPKIGLKNIRVTCYIATFQYICHIGKIVNFFIYRHVISLVRNNKNILTSSIKLLTLYNIKNYLVIYKIN